ncbi:hypothetical protein [Chamaesiphon sp.]|uniref:hypothetical protein n=1 Tax=Chamaesiphon sp. TaxID=2814140 RepID=UPI003593531C
MLRCIELLQEFHSTSHKSTSPQLFRALLVFPRTYRFISTTAIAIAEHLQRSIKTGDRQLQIY